MSKKKKKKNKVNQVEMTRDYLNLKSRSKKQLRKEFNDAIDDIESYRIQLFEADKRANKHEKRRINKQEKEFYTSMESIKCRQKMAKKWRKTGFLETIISLLQTISPYIKLLAKGVCILITAFLNIESVAAYISPETISKLSKAFDIASCI